MHNVIQLLAGIATTLLIYCMSTGIGAELGALDGHSMSITTPDVTPVKDERTPLDCASLSELIDSLRLERDKLEKERDVLLTEVNLLRAQLQSIRVENSEENETLKTENRNEFESAPSRRYESELENLPADKSKANNLNFYYKSEQMEEQKREKRVVPLVVVPLWSGLAAIVPFFAHSVAPSMLAAALYQHGPSMVKWTFRCMTKFECMQPFWKDNHYWTEYNNFLDTLLEMLFMEIDHDNVAGVVLKIKKEIAHRTGYDLTLDKSEEVERKGEDTINALHEMFPDFSSIEKTEKVETFSEKAIIEETKSKAPGAPGNLRHNQKRKSVSSEKEGDEEGGDMTFDREVLHKMSTTVQHGRIPRSIPNLPFWGQADTKSQHPLHAQPINVTAQKQTTSDAEKTMYPSIGEGREKADQTKKESAVQNVHAEDSLRANIKPSKINDHVKEAVEAVFRLLKTLKERRYQKERNLVKESWIKKVQRFFETFKQGSQGKSLKHSHASGKV